MMRRRLVIGNWKMKGSRHSVTALLKGLQSIDVYEKLSVTGVICPPYIFLQACEHALTGGSFLLGAQNVCQYSADSGAYTGEISAEMLRDFSCQYVLVGHSERRHWYRETDACITDKFNRVLQAGLIPVLCVGETDEQRCAGETQAVIQKQLAAIVELVDHTPSVRRSVIAYEPVWAIGTGHQASPEQAQAVHAAIRSQVREYDQAWAEELQILYGGSVAPQNVAGIIQMPDIDGVLVGGASLSAQNFLEIIKICGQFS